VPRRRRRWRTWCRSRPLAEALGMDAGKVQLPRIPPPDYPAPTFEGPFGNLVRLLGPTPAARRSRDPASAYSSDVLPANAHPHLLRHRSHARLQPCEGTAAQLLDARGRRQKVQREVLDTLARRHSPPSRTR
jgi:hypothetical protein